MSAVSGFFPLRSMRAACLPVMASLGERYPQVVAMGADGCAIFESFAQQFPERFVDVGIAEANLVGVAAGLAHAGKVVFVATIASFLLRRAYEQIRVDVCDPGLPVKFVGVGGGLSYGALGSTHHMVEDIALTRVLPHIAVFIPTDAYEVEYALYAALDWPGPVYIRLGTGSEPLIHEQGARFVPYEPELLRAGRDVMIFAMGYCVSQALLAAARLACVGYDVGVTNVHTMKPCDGAALLRIAEGCRAVLVVEEHCVLGGLGSMVAEVFSRFGGCPVERMGLPDQYLPVGSREELISAYGLDDGGIAAMVQRVVEGARV